MMDGATILVVFIFLLVVAVFAGIGIGLVIGLVRWGRNEDQTSPPPQPVTQPAAYAPVLITSQGGNAALPVADVVPESIESAPEPDSAQVDEQIVPETLPDAVSQTDEPVVAPVPLAAEPVRPARRTQSWSVALAIGVIVICCVCTFLLAALTVLTR